MLGDQEVTVLQQSQFPQRGHSELVVHLARPARFGLLFRVAPWAKGLKLQLNSQPVESVVHGRWASVPVREWRDGDRVTLSFPLAARLIPGEFGNKDRGALSWGPFVLAYDRASNPALRRRPQSAWFTKVSN